MITAPDVVALTREDDYEEQYSEEPAPHFQFQPENSWSKTATAKFEKDFILISEFSEQVGPQPLLTIPDNARGNFDLNYFSLRIMSVDYQASFVGHPPGTSYPKLNFVEDSKVVLGDSKEGAFAYVHHLTLYDLEARGFVRPFCVAYISMDENKIMQQFQELSDDFSKASECLKTGNRKAFANELENKLKDLEYTRNVLHNETEIQKKSNDKGYYSSVAIEKANELANVEKCIIEHQDLLMQIRNYSYKKTRDRDYFSYEPENDLEPSDSGLEQLQYQDELCEKNGFSDRKSYIPKFTKAKSAKCFEKKLKTLEELCDSYFFNRTLEQLRQVEKFFRGDVCYLLSSQIEKSLLQQQQTTSFLFEGPLLFTGEEQTEKEQHSVKPLSGFNINAKILNHSCLSIESAGFESYKSCVESVAIKLDQQTSVESYHGTMADSIPSKNHLGTSDYLELEGKEKGSISSGESIEVLGTEKSSSAPMLSKSESQSNSQSHHPEVVRRKFVHTKRTNSEDSIEVLSTTESLIPEDLKPVYPNAIHEEEPPSDNEEIRLSRGLVQPDANLNHTDEFGNIGFENRTLTLSVLSEPVDPSCCIGKESPNFTKSVPTFITEEYSDGVVNVPPQRSKTIGQIYHSDCLEQVDGGGLYNAADQVFSTCEKEYNDLPDNEETNQIQVDEYMDNMSYISASLCSDRTPSPAIPISPSQRLSGKRKKHSGKNSLWFIRQYSFAQQAIFSLLSGRTLVIVGEQEGKVKKLINALSIFVPSNGKDADSVKQWITSPLHINELQTWKLIGLQRIASPLGTRMLHSLNRYSRYISILDCDNKTLRCPQYKGQLITRLADHRTQIKRGSTYYMHVHNMLTQLCSQAFLYTFCHHLHLPIDERESEESVTYRRINFLKHHLGLMNDDSKIVQYFAELIKMHYLHEPPKGLNPVLRFNYIPTVMFKI